jgi:hypothetical protein
LVCRRDSPPCPTFKMLPSLGNLGYLTNRGCISPAAADRNRAQLEWVVAGGGVVAVAVAWCSACWLRHSGRLGSGLLAGVIAGDCRCGRLCRGGCQRHPACDHHL